MFLQDTVRTPCWRSWNPSWMILFDMGRVANLAGRMLYKITIIITNVEIRVTLSWITLDGQFKS